MIYTAYNGTKFDNLDVCDKYNNKLKEKYSKNSVDPIYLLSNEEYKYYKKDILLIPTEWWLRSPGDSFLTAATVRSDGSINSGGELIHYVCFGVRPVLNLEHLKSKLNSTYGAVPDGFPYRFTWAGATWRTLEENKIAIAEMPIFYSVFDSESNDYKSSFVRNKLLQWYNSRIRNHFLIQEVIGI